jgi:hypothetical protein
MIHSLSEDLSSLIRKWEDGGGHDAQAHDEHCDLCRLLADLRVLQILHAAQLGGLPAPRRMHYGGRRLS